MPAPLRPILLALALGTTALAADPRPVPEPFRVFKLPNDWVERFWADPATKALFKLEPQALAALVPTQAGLKYCRCPSCPAGDLEDPLGWSSAKPDLLTCRKCAATFPNDKIPAKADGKIPDESIEVRPGVFHHYPYHAPNAEGQRYPDERIYLAAKRDYEAREYLAKAALYAALKHRDSPTGHADPALSRFACLVVLKFAHVYPNYATHFDQPGEPKFIQQAELKPPFRRYYRTGKWDTLGSLDVPINLVIAYALVRDTPALAEAGKVLNDPDPARTIERSFFRASADFVRRQPEEYAESSLPAYRGLLAVANLLGDAELLREAQARLDEFTRRGFYHDGLWRQGNTPAHRRVMLQLEGWVDPLAIALGTERRPLEILPLARRAEGSFLARGSDPEVLPVSWTPSAPERYQRRPILLGGAGVARLAVGEGSNALDLELRGQDGYGDAHFQRQSIRLGVGGTPVLDDLDELPTVSGGWNLATPSHNTVTIDGLNQRESFARAREPAAGGDFLYFASDPDFQCATLDDPRAYPVSAKRYRQTVILSTSGPARYGLSVFEVEGGLQHDQVFHSRAGSGATWTGSVEFRNESISLLPPKMPYLPGARAEDGRWFVQSYGEFRDLSVGTSQRADWMALSEPGKPGVRLHLLGDSPRTLIRATTPIPRPADGKGPADPGRASLIVRRSSLDGETLKSTFVTLFEPLGTLPPLKAVGKVRTEDSMVVVQVETAEGLDWVFVNLKPGTSQTAQLPDGRTLSSDGLAVRVRGDDVVLAGGTFARLGGSEPLNRARVAGPIKAVVRQPSEASRGWFEVAGPIPDPEALAGRTLLIRHGDGVSHGWTIQRIDAQPDGTARLHVIEEPGFSIDQESGEARYYQFPGRAHPAPHKYSISGIARTSVPVVVEDRPILR